MHPLLSFGRAAWLFSLCLLIQSPPSATAPAPSSSGKEAHPADTSPRVQKLPIQVHSLTGLDPDSENQKNQNDDLFPDVDPKVLAAVLLQALQNGPENPEEPHPKPDPNASEEKDQGEDQSFPVEPEGQPGWKGSRDVEQSQEELEEEEEEEEENRSVAEESTFGQQELESLKAMLEELKHYHPTTKREEPPRASSAVPSGLPESDGREDVLQELDQYLKLKVHTKRKAPPGEPWAGARKLRQQQHLEHQLLQRRYEELAESRRQAEEARRAAAEEERLADMASDLLLQYLLKDGEEEEEEEEGANSRGESEEARPNGSSLLFEDEESNVAEDKRSNEMPPEGEEDEEDEEDIDPHTIDRLIELSSKLHLPADDVVDLINNVEKKKKDLPGLKAKGKPPAPPAWKKPPKTPPHSAYPQETMPGQRPFRPAPYQPYPQLPKQDQAAWNEVWKGEEFPVPKWHRAKAATTTGSSGHQLSNYIDPRTSRPAAYSHLRRLPGPMVPRDGFYGDSQGRDEELENYIERVLVNHPKAFQ